MAPFWISTVNRLHDGELAGAFVFDLGYGLEVLSSRGLPPEEREKWAKEVGLKLVFWAWANQYEKVRESLSGEKQHRARARDLIASLPTSADNTLAFGDQLAAVIGLTREQMQVIIERVGKMAAGELAGQV